MGPFLYDVKSINRKLSSLEGKVCELQATIDNPVDPGPGGNATFVRVANYSALPDPSLHTDEYYHVLASQGDRWIPGWLGGANFYGKGFYYSNGANWLLAGDIPYQATQTEANAGLAMDVFITPGTLAASTTVSHPGHTHPDLQNQINDLENEIVALAVAL